VAYVLRASLASGVASRSLNASLHVAKWSKSVAAVFMLLRLHLASWLRGPAWLRGSYFINSVAKWPEWLHFVAKWLDGGSSSLAWLRWLRGLRYFRLRISWLHWLVAKWPVAG
jgi:hypothetical protein